MAGTSGSWDAGAGVSKWLQPDERILWRGSPDASVIFAPQDLYVVPVSILWLGFALFWEHGVIHQGTVFAEIWGIPFVLLGLYVLFGRFVAKAWSRRRTFYAVTNRRAVRITDHGQSLRQVPVTTTMETHRSRDARHGTATWMLWANGTEMANKNGTSGRRSLQTALFGGTNWPGTGRYEANELTFVDVVDFDQLLAAARHAGFSVSVGQPKGGFRLRDSLPAPARADAQTPGPSPGLLARIRWWVRTRLLRRPYAFWSPLPSEEVATRLSRNLAPERQFSLGFGGPGMAYRGTVSGWSVHLSARGTGQGNSWRTVFDGGIVAGEQGSWLTGSIGPVAFVPVFSCIWLGLVSLFFVIGVIGLLSDLSTGRGASFLPFVLIPAGMMAFFFVMTEFGSRTSQNEWEKMDLWLRRLLEVPMPPRP
jgi:hypothetical protein